MSDIDVVLERLDELKLRSKENHQSVVDKLESLDARLDRVDVTLALQETNLDHHIKRTDIAEKRLEHLQEQLEPIKAHVQGLKGIGKAVAILCTILGAVAAAFRMMPI